MRPHRSIIRIIPHVDTTVSSDIVPLKQHEVTAQSRGKFELVAVRVKAIGQTNSCMGDVRPVRIIRVKVGSVYIIRDEFEWVCIETGLCGHLER